jgi:hypothetical protein
VGAAPSGTGVEVPDAEGPGVFVVVGDVADWEPDTAAPGAELAGAELSAAVPGAELAGAGLAGAGLAGAGLDEEPHPASSAAPVMHSATIGAERAAVPASCWAIIRPDGAG